MYDKDHASLEALIDKSNPSRLMIDVRLQPPSLGGGASYQLGDLRRAVREGFREALGEVAFERLVKVSDRPKGRARRWLGRVCAFVGCAAIGGFATLLLSAFLSHTVQRYAAQEERLATLPGSSEAAVSPGSQSAALPGASTAPAPAPKSAAGPATFGLYEK
jgi:hypothetical protein